MPSEADKLSEKDAAHALAHAERDVNRLVSDTTLDQSGSKADKRMRGTPERRMKKRFQRNLDKYAESIEVVVDIGLEHAKQILAWKRKKFKNEEERAKAYPGDMPIKYETLLNAGQKGLEYGVGKAATQEPVPQGDNKPKLLLEPMTKGHLLSGKMVQKDEVPDLAPPPASDAEQKAK